MISETVSAHLARIERSGAIGALIWIGAGGAGAAEAALATGAQRILLAEPEPGQARALEARAADEPRLEIAACAIAPEAGQRELQVFNMAALSSLRAPAGLQELFPGLRRTGTPRVATRTMAGLLESFGALPGGHAVLILGQAGEEGAILSQLRGGGQLDCFSHILLQAGAEAFYEGAEPGPDLVRALAAEGWQLLDEDRDDPDFPVYLLQADTAGRRIARLQAELEEAGARNAELAAARQAAQQKTATLVRERDAALQKVKTLTAERDAALEKLQTLTEGRDAALKKAETLTAERDAALKKAGAGAERKPEEAAQQLRQAREEMLKAEGQIRLLRDILLSGPGL